MTAAETHEHVIAFFYALGRLDAVNDDKHADNVTEAEEFADVAAHEQFPLPDLYRDWRTNRLIAPRSPEVTR